MYFQIIITSYLIEHFPGLKSPLFINIDLWSMIYEVYFYKDSWNLKKSWIYITESEQNTYDWILLLRNNFYSSFDIIEIIWTETNSSTFVIMSNASQKTAQKCKSCNNDSFRQHSKLRKYKTFIVMFQGFEISHYLPQGW